MADTVSTSRPKTPDQTSGLADKGDHDAAAAHPHDAWVLLDEASQDLVRAEAIVALLGLEMQASQHQLYAADIAGEFLRAASARVSEALDLVRDIDLVSRSQRAVNT
jgi:hypothetical protein